MKNQFKPGLNSPENTSLLLSQISQDVSQTNIKMWFFCMTEFSDINKLD